jgi:vacuolar iron transporter family protein
VLTAGVSAAVASALSMATGAFLAERSEAEVAAANVERERQEIAEHPEEEQEELSLFYELKGIDEATANSMAEQLAREPDAMLRALSVEEFGVTGDHGNPTQAAVAAGISTGVGAIVPVIPFIFTTGTVAIVTAAVISLGRPLPGRGGQVARDAPLVVVGGTGDDACRRHCRWGDLPRRLGATHLTPPLNA